MNLFRKSMSLKSTSSSHNWHTEYQGITIVFLKVKSLLLHLHPQGLTGHGQDKATLLCVTELETLIFIVDCLPKS